MRRRDFVVFTAGAALGWPLAAQGQQSMPVIGFLSGTSADPAELLFPAFREGLSEAGYVQGQNVVLEFHGADGRYDQLPALAADLVSRKVDLIATAAPPAALAAKNATSNIPIVFALGSDPVTLGLVASLARPGGNLTGVSFVTVELLPKVLELLSELVPEVRVMGVLIHPDNLNTGRNIADVQKAADAKRVQLHILKARTESEIDAAFATLVRMRAGALVVVGDAVFTTRRKQIVALAARHAIPAAYTDRVFTASAGLMSYGASYAAAFRQAGRYAARILNGERPAELPVLLPTKFELVINLTTAKTLDLKMPPSLLARADEVIE
jgi:putative ABC transport system substrate-binding protein